jgi:hypothetical protein
MRKNSKGFYLQRLLCQRTYVVNLRELRFQRISGSELLVAASTVATNVISQHINKREINHGPATAVAKGITAAVAPFFAAAITAIWITAAIRAAIRRMLPIRIAMQNPPSGVG